MHTGRLYQLRDVLLWTRTESLYMIVVACVPVVLSVGLGWRWVEIPWVPVAMLGTASAFTVGFRNNATYARMWEARQIWGGIVNASRTWGLMARDMVDHTEETTDDGPRSFVYRHLAWLTALRYQLRERRTWENFDRPDNRRFRESRFAVPEHDGALAPALTDLLGESEATFVQSQSNRATAILAIQSARLKQLAARGAIDSYRHVALARQIAELLELQGRCERIKNFPYPRQFATLNFWFIRLFVWLVPFGMLQEFRKMDHGGVWLTIPFSVLITWLFLALEKVGESTENPFEGSANDVPITALSRTIEIDLRQMLSEHEVPPALAPVRDVLM
jgi:ion channel-forming bestrophin family protein